MNGKNLSTEILKTQNEQSIWQAIRTTIVSQGFRIASLALSLVSVPLYLKWLGQERYGLLLTGSALMGYLMFSSGGLSWASMILIAQAHGRQDRNAIQSIVRNSLTLSVCSVLVVCTVVVTTYVLLRNGVSIGFLPSHPEMPGLLLGLGASAAVSLMISPIYNVFSGLQEMSTVAMYQGVGTLLNAILLLAVAYVGTSLGWMFGVATIGSAVCGFVAVMHCVYKHRWVFRWGKIWQKDQINAQWRSGAKCLLMQVGVVLTATAPVLSISSSVGPEWAPYYSIPFTLLSVPLGVLLQLNVGLQPAYGQAIGRGDLDWIAKTVTMMARRVITLLGVVGVCFVILSPAFITTWTQGRIQVSYLMLVGVFLSGTLSAIAAVYRTLLAGVNRHASAAIGDLMCGLATVALTPVVVQAFGVDATGYSAFICMALTLAWLFPMQFRQIVGYNNVIKIEPYFIVRLLVTSTIAAMLAILISMMARGLGCLGELLATSIATCVIFICVGSAAGLDDCRMILRKLRERWIRFVAIAS